MVNSLPLVCQLNGLTLELSLAVLDEVIITSSDSQIPSSARGMYLSWSPTCWDSRGYMHVMSLTDPNYIRVPAMHEVTCIGQSDGFMKTAICYIGQYVLHCYFCVSLSHGWMLLYIYVLLFCLLVLLCSAGFWDCAYTLSVIGVSHWHKPCHGCEWTLPPLTTK